MGNDTKPKTKKRLSGEEEQLFMKTAPIAEVAEYLGIDLDLAVQLRIDEATSGAYRKLWGTQHSMEVAVRPIEPQGNLYGFASVTVGGIKIDDFKIVTNRDGELFVGMPSKPDKTSKTGYRNTVSVDKESYEAFTDAVLDEYHAVVERARIRAEKMQMVSEKPLRIAEQMAKAAKEAAAHNAALPTKEKRARTHADRGA